MNTKITTTILLTFCMVIMTHIGVCQSDGYRYKAVYKLNYQPDSTDQNSRTSEKMLLFLNNSGSEFSSVGKHMRDSVLANAPEGQNIQSLLASVPRTEFDYQIIKERPSGKITYAAKIVKDRLRYDENTADLKWKIRDEIKSISGYRCQKADLNYGKRTYTAWFTKDIPISDGPYKFAGLPGLIIAISDDQDHYNFKLISFTSLKSSKESTFTADRYISTTKEKLWKVEKKYKDNPLALLEQSGIQVDFPNEAMKSMMIQQYKEEMARKNNPIELKSR